MEYLKTYISPITGSEIIYSPKESFPPGSGTAKIAEIAAYDLTMFRHVSGNIKQPVNVLDLGTGSGIFPVELYGHLNVLENVNFEGIDISPINVRLTNLNIARIARKHNFQPNAKIEVRDWRNSSIWKSFESKSFNFIHFNPPFYKPQAIIPVKLSGSPDGAMFAPDANGLYHYRMVLPELARIFSHQSGSAIVFRLPDDVDESDLANNEDRTIGRVLSRTLERIAVQCNVFYYNFDSKTARKRFCKIQIPIIEY